MSDMDKIELEAARWIARIDAGLAPAGEAEFDVWLSLSPAHRIAFLRLEAVWQNADRLGALGVRGEIASGANRRGNGLRVLLAAAAVFLVVLGGAGTVLYLRGASQIVYATRVGQHGDFKLADGTKIELNTNTRVQAHVTSTARTVTLQHGEAYFEVVHDAKRPFVVMVGNHRVTDIGTKFSILRVGDDAEIIVKEGRVRIDALGASRPQAPVFADGGSVVLARADETVVASKPAQVITDELDWRRGRLVFNQETLQDAAAEFNRYNETKIVVRGKAKDIRVGGSFKADNLESFAWLIREGFHVSVRKRGNEIIVSK